jgi:hypothetical protein
MTAPIILAFGGPMLLLGAAIHPGARCTQIAAARAA